jgi:hypothetical protein
LRVSINTRYGPKCPSSEGRSYLVKGKVSRALGATAQSQRFQTASGALGSTRVKGEALMSEERGASSFRRASIKIPEGH